MPVVRVVLLAVCLAPFSNAAAQTPPQTCPEGGAHDAFDFWTGRWEVYRHDDRDTLVGHNTISEDAANCTLLEKWRNVQGASGSSINWYNPVTESWRQLWVSPGMEIDISGGPDDDGVMRLEGEITYFRSGETHPFRGAWQALGPDRVRQTFHQYDPESAEWSVWFDGLYVRAAD